MAAPQDNGNGAGHNPLPDLAALSVGNLTAAQRRLAIARAARENATEEEIEARGIRPDVQQIIRHMNETSSHPIKCARLDNSTVQRIYRPDHGDDEEDSNTDHDHDHDKKSSYKNEEEFNEERWASLLAKDRLQNSDPDLLGEFQDLARQRIRMLQQGTAAWDALHRPPKKSKHFDMILELSIRTELIVEVCKHLRPIDIVQLYSTSRPFHNAINQNMRNSVFTWAAVMAPSAARIYSSPVYCHWFIPDPAGRTVTDIDKKMSETKPGQARLSGGPELNKVEGEVRLIPGLLWLQMVVNREIRVRDIIATLARMGHRMPKGAHLTLKKLWVAMDVATTKGRMILLNNPDFFSNKDLYIAQLFMVKLVLAFNDPVYGPQSTMLMRLMMGQKGLSPLWALLRGKKHRSPEEIRQMKLRYDVGPDQVPNPEKEGLEVDELGVIHFEGWGTGRDHLLRPDELIPLEAARRQLNLDSCIKDMMIYGHVNLRTGRSLVPSLDEMYMSDDDLPPAHRDWKPLRYETINGGCGNVPFAPTMWQPKHARKARWKKLTAEEKAMILKEEQCEMDEVKELGSAQAKLEAARERLKAAVRITKVKQELEEIRNGVFKLLPPYPCDFHDQLPAVWDPPPSPKAMDFDSDFDCELDPEASNPCSPRFSPSSMRARRAQLSHSPSSSLGRALPPTADVDMDVDPDLDEYMDLGDLDGEDLTLLPISRSELRHIYNAFRPPRSPHDEDDDEEEEEGEDEEIYDDQEIGQDNAHNPNPSSPSSSSDEEDEDEHEQDNHNAHQDLIRRLLTRPPHPLSHHTFQVPDGIHNENHNGFHPINNGVNNNYNILLTPATTAMSVSTDDMLLAQADVEYSDHDHEEEGNDAGDEDDDGEQYEDGMEEDGVEDDGDDDEMDDEMDEYEEGEIYEDEEEQLEEADADANGVSQKGSILDINRILAGEGAGTGTGDGNQDGGLVGSNQPLAGAGGQPGSQNGDALDWDDFLRNPVAYLVEGEGSNVDVVWDDDDEVVDEEAVEEGVNFEDGEGGEDEEPWEDGEGFGGGEEGGEEHVEEDGGVEAEVEDEDAAGGEQDVVEAGPEVEGGQGMVQDGRQVAVMGGGEAEEEEEEEEEVSSDEYANDEDLYEDDLTKNLRDWFRPW